MALIDILRDIASRDGDDIDNQGEKDTLITYVNQAARKVYETTDLKESLVPEVFDMNVESQLVALPWYVDTVRGFRYFDGREPIDIDDARNRWGKDWCNEVYGLKYRDHLKSPFQRDVSNEGRLTLSIPLAESVAFNVSIVAATPNSARIEEVVTFGIGDLEKETVNTFKKPFSAITKSITTIYDLSIRDVENNLLSVIPNYKKSVVYRIVQILDTESAESAGTISTVECLFKIPFPQMRDDGDQFLGTDRYDKAIYWKYKEINEENDEKKALGFLGQFTKEMNQLDKEESVGKKRRMSFQRRLNNLPYRYGVNEYRYPYRGA